jgi:outer membrane protein OmpA-like peptidoglycan-associated protein
VYGSKDVEFDEYKFFDGRKMVRVEGRLWERIYRLMENAREASSLQIRRNHVNAVKSMGGTVLYDGNCGEAQAQGCEATSSDIMTARVVRGAKALWVNVSPWDRGYTLTVLETEEMKQDVTASDMLQELQAKGSVALYINFDVDKATIQPGSQPIIDQIVALLKQNAGLKISIEGHTDNTGTRQRNKTLSEQRAKAVADAIARQGVERARLSAVGWGQDKPLADNGTEDGRAKNRRVELVKK